MQRLCWNVIVPVLALMMMPGVRLSAAQEEATTDQRLKKLEEEVKSIKTQVDLMRSMQEMLQELQRLNKRVGQLEDQLQNAGGVKSTSKFPPAVEKTGTIQLENRSLFAATVIINDVAYEVAPGMKRIIKAVPTGNFRYQVDTDEHGTIRSLVTRTLGEKETFKITVYP